MRDVETVAESFVKTQLRALVRTLIEQGIAALRASGSLPVDAATPERRSGATAPRLVPTFGPGTVHAVASALG